MTQTLLRALGGLIAAAFIAYMMVPIALPVIYSFSSVWQGILPEGLTLDSYRKVLAGAQYVPAIALSFQVALSALLLVAVLAVPAAWGVYRARSPLAAVMRQALLIFPMVAGPLILAVGYLLTFNRPPFDFSGTVWIIVAGHAALGFPFMFRAVLADMETLALDRLTEAARVCGAPWWTVWFRVLVPNLAGSVISGGLIVFALSFGEFEIAKMVGGFGFRTLPVLLFQSLREDFRTASAVAAILVYVAVLGLIAVSLLRARTTATR
jgi:putative spermidine/putrescine transport system permease protein